MMMYIWNSVFFFKNISPVYIYLSRYSLLFLLYETICLTELIKIKMSNNKYLAFDRSCPDFS